MSIRRPPADQTPIHSADELTERWQRYLETEPFRFRALWALFLERTGRPAGPVITVDNLPDGPYDMEREDLVVLCREILDGPGGGGSVALLMSRPCGAPWTVSDRAWGRFLVGAADEIGGRVWPVHLAHRQTLERFVLQVPEAFRVG